MRISVIVEEGVRRNRYSSWRLELEPKKRPAVLVHCKFNFAFVCWIKFMHNIQWKLQSELDKALKHIKTCCFDLLRWNIIQIYFILFKIVFFFFFLHDSNGTSEIPYCGNLVGADWVWKLRRDHMEPYTPFRWVYTETCARFSWDHAELWTFNIYRN